MAGSAHPGDKLNVFISYSRDDLVFADQLDAALGLGGFETTIDRHGISGGEDWKKRLGALIRDADTVVFVLSPSSARSDICAWEVEEAVRLGKRIIPVLCCPLEGASPPQHLTDLNYIFFYAEPKSPGSGFGTGLVRLTAALNTDLDWLREHTRYLQRASEWDAGGRAANRLLSGSDIATAKAWAACRPKDAPEPTPLQLDFIKASELEESRQRSAEAQRLWEVEFQLDRANRALAAWINSDLGFEPYTSLKTRERNALWKLACANEPVKRHFVSILAGSPEETVRTSPGFAQIWRALGPLRPSAAEADDLVIAVVRAYGTTEVVRNAKSLTAELEALVPKISEARASQALDFLLKQISETTDSDALRAHAEALPALAAKLSEAQASQALDFLLKQIGETTGQDALRAYAEALRALAAKLNEAQASQALDFLLKRIGEMTHAYALRGLAEALRALAAKLSEAQASQALDFLLKRIGETTNPDALRVLAGALPALAARLSESQASQALDSVLKQIGETTNPYALGALAGALPALPANLSEAQAGQALDSVLKQIGEPTDPYALGVLAEALPALAAKLNEAQASEALDLVLKQIGEPTNLNQLGGLAGALPALAAKLSEAQASQALDPVLKQIGETTNPDALGVLAEALRGLAAKLSEAQASQALDPVLKRIGQTSHLGAVGMLAEALGALAAKLSEVQASQALDFLPIFETKYPYVLRAHARALGALPARLSEAQAGQALDVLLKQISETTDPDAFRVLAEALQALAAKLSEAQAGQALDVLLKQIGETTDPDAFRVLAEVLQALAPRLSDARAAQGSKAAASSLAWARSNMEAVEWARALVALTHPASGRDEMLMSAIAYPTAAGSATEILLDAIRAEHPDAPVKEAGIEPALAWLAKKFPILLRPPLCPKPLQPGLECPPSSRQQD